MKAGRYFFVLLKSLITFIVLLVLLVGVLDFLNLTFTIDGARKILVKNFKAYTGRNVRIDGDVELTISLFPQLLVQRIHISNPDSFNNEDFITVSEVRVDALLVPLLSGQLHLSDISADQSVINLIKKKDGAHNWTFEMEEITSKPAAKNLRNKGSGTGNMSRLFIGEFHLTNVTIKYSDESRDQIIDTQLDELAIDLTNRAKPAAEIYGSVQDHPYSITFESDALELLQLGKTWLLHGTGHIAKRKTTLEASIQLINNGIRSNIDINVNKVNLGALVDALGLASGQDATTENISVKVKTQGIDLAELYEQAEIKLQLGDGFWKLPSQRTDKTKKLYFTQASSSISWNRPVLLKIDGNLLGELIKFDLKTSRLSEFFDDIKILDIDLVSNVAGIDFTLNGTLDLPINSRQYQLDITLKGKDLEKLNPILDTEFPPFNNFSLTGKLISQKNGFILKSANASVGDSQMQAAIVVDNASDKPLWTIGIDSRQIQLKDYAFDDMNIKQVNDTDKNTTLNNNERPLHLALRKLEEFVRSPKMHLNLNLKVDKVLSGEDRLGKAQFLLHILANEFSIKNVDIELPGGRIKSSVSLKRNDGEASGHLVLDIDKLDYGITTRFFKSDSKVDGMISTRIDMELSGRDFTRLLDKAAGQIDIVVWPRNTKPAKILNLWATNLYLILLPELKKTESKVNCFVGLMDVNNGTMKEEFFAIDTTKLWIHGNINVDFKQEYVKLSLFPRSKTARLFSLQSPIRAQGSFTNLHLQINPVDLTTTYISFITSPLYVPARWIFEDKPPEDGSAVCEKFFDRAYLENLNKELKLREKLEIDEILESD